MHSAQRPLGVTIPQGQRRGDEIPAGDLPSLSVHNFSRLEMFVGRYVDKTGKLVPGLYVKRGDDFYLDPNGPHWLGTLQELSKDHVTNVRREYERLTNSTPVDAVPSEDAVDVVAGEVAEEPTAPADVDVLPEEG